MTTSGSPARPAWAPEDLEVVPVCPVCGARARTPWLGGLRDRLDRSSGTRWELVRCDGCGCAYLPVRPTPETIGRLYSAYYTHAVPEADPGPVRLRRRLRNGYLARRYGYDLSPASRAGHLVMSALPGGRGLAGEFVRDLPAPRGTARLLDVGCGNGAFVRLMRDLGWDAEGVEPDERAAARAREAGLPVRGGALEPDEAGRGRFDVVTLSHVIEHVHDPADLLRRCSAVLRPGGLLWVATPNLMAAGAARFGADWVQLDPPRHLVLFTRASLGGLLVRCGYTSLAEPPVAPQALPWVFASSVAVAAGRSGDEPAAMDRATTARAALADLTGLVRRDRAQNVVMTAVRPAGPVA